jgi:hypothetical protein
MCRWPLPAQSFSVVVLRDLRSYFTVSDLRLSFSSPPTTRRVTVEVFDPASTRVTSSSDFLYPFITPWYGPRRKYSLYIIEIACLLIRCLAMDVILFRVYASPEMCLQSCCLALGLYVTIFTQKVISRQIRGNVVPWEFQEEDRGITLRGIIRK